MDQQPIIIWDKGSAYDFFVSMMVLHQPDEFGLRASWAAGVRSRLPIPMRDVLEHTQQFLNVPLSFIYKLPDPKDAFSALEALRALPPEDRLPALSFGYIDSPQTREYQELLLSLEGKQRLSANLEAQIKEGYRPSTLATKTVIRALFDAWVDRAAFGEAMLDAFVSFYENFYQEEEVRINPAQEKVLEKAQMLAARSDVMSVLEELSSGVRMDMISDASRLVLAPSFWAAPFVIFNRLDEDTRIILFGTRPKGMALVPGDLVPEELLNSLKALADPTRLRILRYLLEGPSTISELAKILRLRPPTVIHHLQCLRLAGLVLVTVSPEAERRYSVRMNGIKTTFHGLQEFLSGD